MLTVLYVDDERGLLDMGKLFLESQGEFRVDIVTSASAALPMLSSGNYDAIISDYKMPEMDGIDLLKRVRSLGNIIPFILFTGRGREEIVIQALNEGADFYLQKGGEPVALFTELAHKIRSAVVRKKAEIALRESERVQATMISNLPGFVYRCTNDSSWTMKYISSGCREITGYSPDELLENKTLTYNDLVHTDFQKPLWDNIQNALSRREPFKEEYPLRTKNGETRWVWEQGQGIFADDGHLLFLEGFITDITGRKQMEMALKESEERLRDIIEKNPLSIQIVDKEGFTLKVNHAHTRLFGSVPPPEFSIFVDLVKKQPGLESLIARVKNGELVMMPDIRFNAHDTYPDYPDVPVWVRAIIFPLKDKSGRPERFVLMHENITEQKEAKERLSEINRTFLTFGPDPLENITILTGLAGRMLKGSCALYNRLEGGMLCSLGMWNTPSDFAPSDTPDGHICTDIIQNGSASPTIIPNLLESAYADTDPNVRRYQLRTYVGIPVKIGDRFLGSLCVVYQDTVSPAQQDLEILAVVAKAIAIEDERRTAGLAQIKRAAFLEAQAEASPDGMLVVNEKNERILINQRLIGMWEIPDTILQDSNDEALLQYVALRATSPDQFIRNVRDLNSHPEESDQAIVEFSSGKVYDRYSAPVIDRTGQYHGRIWTFRDITERRRAEEALRLANKKLTLLSGITRHDIKNQLTVLLGYLAILKKKQPATAQSEFFIKAAEAAQRIASMIQFTREYENIGINAPVWQDVRSLVDTAAKEAPLGQVVIENDLPSGAEVFADPLVVRVMYALMENAVRYGGKISTIRFSVQESGNDHLIVCEDDGIGVPAEEKELIFERGFGKNTGLGLALSREILSITEITIAETGEPGKGARFEMTVPKGACRFTDKNKE